MKDLLIICICALGMSAISAAKADKYHYSNNYPDNYQQDIYITVEQPEPVSEPPAAPVVNEYTTVEGNTYIQESGVAAVLAASQLNFDWGTDSWQLAGGLGNYENHTAGSVGFGKRIKNILVNGSYSRESGVDYFGIGGTIRLK